MSLTSIPASLILCTQGSRSRSRSRFGRSLALGPRAAPLGTTAGQARTELLIRTHLCSFRGWIPARSPSCRTSRRSPRSVLEMVEACGASLRILARLLPLTKMDHRGAGCSIKRAVGDFMRPSCRLARGSIAEERSGTLFLQVGWARMKPAGALIC